MVSGMPPMPNWIVEPSRICSTMRRAMVLSTSVGVSRGSSTRSGLSPSTTKSTSEMCTHSSRPPRQTGSFSFTSTMTVLAFSTMARVDELYSEKLK